MTVPLSPASLRQIPGRSRPGWRRHGFLLAVVAPTLLVLLYLVVVAAPRYTVQFRYSVFTDSGTKNDTMELVTTAGRASKQSDFMVADYVNSGQIVSDLSARLNLAKMFKPPGFDFVFRFWWDNGTPERLTDYWRNWAVSTHFDTYSELGEIEVSAFTPQDALKLAQTVLSLSETALNAQEQRARDTAVSVVQEQVTRADARVQAARQKIVEFRQAQRMYVPSHPADSTEALAASLRQNLASMNTQYQSLSRTLSPTSPALMNLKSQRTATEQELDRVLSAFANDETTPIQPRPGAAPHDEASAGVRHLPVQLGSFQYLETELRFAEAAYDITLTHLEQVTYNAKVQHFYMNTHVRPLLPREASHPRTVVWTLMTFITLSVCWMIGTLLFFAMRDHTR